MDGTKYHRQLMDHQRVTRLCQVCKVKKKNFKDLPRKATTGTRKANNIQQRSISDLPPAQL